MNLQTGMKSKYRIIIGSSAVRPRTFSPVINQVKEVLLSFFSGYTMTEGEGGWHEDGAPYAGGGQDPNKVMEEPVWIFDVVCQPDFDFTLVITELAKVIPEWFADQIMVEMITVATMHFSAKEIRGL